MERRLLAELQSTTTSSSGDEQLKELYSRVSDLRAHVILNYLAVLKIAKKHDKQSPNNPIREQALSRPLVLLLLPPLGRRLQWQGPRRACPPS